MRMSTYGKPIVISCGDETAEYLALPRGSEPDVKAIIDNVKGDTEEFTCLNKRGFPFFVEVKYSSVRNRKRQTVGRMAFFVDISEKKQIEQDREKLIGKLQDALDHIKTLRGIIPICAACKNIRDDKGFWHQVETYVREHSEASFTHSICPSCAKRLYPDLEIYKDESSSK